MNQLFAILLLTGLVIAIPLIYWAWVDRQPPQPTETDWRGWFTESCPMEPEPIADEWPEDVTAYGTTAVHRACLDARRDGGRPCYMCAPVLAGVA